MKKNLLIALLAMFCCVGIYAQKKTYEFEENERMDIRLNQFSQIWVNNMDFGSVDGDSHYVSPDRLRKLIKEFLLNRDGKPTLPSRNAFNGDSTIPVKMSNAGAFGEYTGVGRHVVILGIAPSVPKDSMTLVLKTIDAAYEDARDEFIRSYFSGGYDRNFAREMATMAYPRSVVLCEYPGTSRYWLNLPPTAPPPAAPPVIEELIEIVDDEEIPSDEEVSSREKVELSDDPEHVYEVVDILPTFPGGEAMCMTWLSRNLKYPEACAKKGIQGRVMVTFVVDKDGSISEVKVMRSPHDLLSKEALRVLQIMPKWKPGTVKGTVVRTKFTLPINFRLNAGLPVVR